MITMMMTMMMMIVMALNERRCLRGFFVCLVFFFYNLLSALHIVLNTQTNVAMTQSRVNPVQHIGH